MTEQQLLDEIRHACWWVRHYRGCRNPLRLSQAVMKLGLSVRDALNKSDNYQAILAAVYIGLSPKDDSPF